MERQGDRVPRDIPLEDFEIPSDFTNKLEEAVLSKCYRNNATYIVLTNSEMTRIVFQIVKKKAYVSQCLEDLKELNTELTHAHVFNTCV